VKKQEPAKPGFYTTTAFDMFRIENGLIAEHWDSVVTVAASNATTIRLAHLATPGIPKYITLPSYPLFHC
jgi:hypothetical protein